MKPLEDELKAALRRSEPAAGFTARVMARVEAESAPPRREWLAGLFGDARWRWATTAALAVVVVAGLALVRRHEERARAETARRQVIFALHLAGHKLNVAMRQVNEIERRNAELGSARRSQ